MALVDLIAGRVVADFEIRNPVGNQLPVVAASRRFVAVADTRDHAIHVHAIADLRAGKGEPREILGADSLTPTRVAFVNRGHGLRLSIAGQTGQMIFDLDKSRIMADDGTAASDSPADDEQSLKIAEGGKVVIVPGGNGEPLQVRLPGRLESATFAALRPSAAGRPGVLAIAFTDYASYRTHIMLCDPATGKPYRLLVSHLQNVRGLAFSASRPLLASVADDQTVCVWSLADIDRAVGQIAGLEVRDEGSQVVVGAVKPDSAAAKAGVVANDVLESIATPNARPQAIQSAAGFLLAVATHKPGSQLVLSVKTKGNLQVPVDRGVDERKPLFSMMFLRTGKLPDWIGWNPAGPYDFSSPNAEKRLGWHTNTGDPAAPVSFVSARAYSEKYYREGIIHHLANEADLARALEQWDKEHPKIMPQPALHFRRPDGALATDNADEFLVHTPVNTLNVGINSDFVSNEPPNLHYVIKRDDRGKLRASETEMRGEAERDGNQWKVNLSGVEWQRGIYQLTVELFSKSGGPALARATVTLRFQPPAPVVHWRQDGEAIQTSETAPLRVMSEKVTLEIALQTSEKQEVEVSFVHQRNGQLQNDAPAVLTRTGNGKLTRDLKLVEGLNRFVVQVVNKGALAGHEDNETAIDEIWISYKPPQELPPRFTRLELAGNAELKRIDGKQVWILNQPSAVFQGKIEAAGVLVRAGWSAGGEPESVLPVAESRQIDFAAKLNNLKVGEVSKVRFWAKSKFSDENSAERSVVYHPPLPNYTLDPWKGDDPVVDGVTLTGTVRAATADPFEISIRVISPTGEVREYKADLDLKAGKWKAAIKLFPGGNTIETVATNKWRRESPVGNLMALHYRRPPRIIEFPQKVEAKETKKLRLDLKVQGPTGLPLREIRVNGVRTEYLVHELATKGDQWTWNLELPEVFVNDGSRDLTQLKIQAVTDDGASPEAAIRVVHLQAPQLPVARFLDPVVEATSRHPKFAVTYRVESRKPLERVQILGGKAPVEIDLKKVAKENQQFILLGEATVALNNGLNNLELIAVNSDGRSPAAKVVVSYVEPAVLILPEKIELRSAKNQLEGELTPSFKANGDLEYRQPADRSLVWLTGFVRWSDPQADALDDPNLKVVATVRDCRQFPVALEPRGQGPEANLRRFRVPMVLISADNQVRIEIPTVGQQSMSHREFKLACSKPVRRQRLHLLIVGVRVRDAANLKSRVLDALSVDPKDRPPQLQGEFVKNPPFERCILYRVLAGEVTRGNVEAQLDRINQEIELSRKRGELLNDVVLIYYQGDDVVVPGTKERWLKTSQNFRHVHMPIQRSGISCQALLRDAGEQLLMVNVAGAMIRAWRALTGAATPAWASCATLTPIRMKPATQAPPCSACSTRPRGKNAASARSLTT